MSWIIPARVGTAVRVLLFVLLTGAKRILDVGTATGDLLLPLVALPSFGSQVVDV
jgi:hypothetical protein